MRNRLLLHAVVVAWLAALGGCARYEYVLLEPGDEQVISDEKRVVLPYEPLEYRMAQLDSRLGIRIANPTDEPVRLVEGKSYLIDSEGETHPVGGGTIAPHSYVALRLPPAPRVYRHYARYPYGYGYGYGYWGHYRPQRWGLGYYPYGVYDPWLAPQVYDVVEYGPHHWEWKTGTVRLHLAYQQDEEQFDHDLVILRRKAQKR